MIKKIVKYFLEFDVIRFKLIKLVQFIEKNYKSNQSNNYEIIDIKRIGTKEGDFTSKKIISFLKSKITLKHKTFLDIGCGDMFLYPNLINNEISEYYGFDINKKNIEHGLKYLKKKKIKIYPDKIEIGSNFGFENINQESIDIAFAQAVTSHLNINSLIVLLRNLKKKMKKDGRFFTSFILINRSKDNEPNIIEWNKINKFNNEPHLVTSYFERDPYHYSVETLKNISQMCGWVYIGEYDYDHDIQRMVEFKII